MKNYPFSFDQLKKFSESTPYLLLESDERALFNKLKLNEEKLNFPAIRDDVGSFINFIFGWQKPKRIFEFGSGYGQSCFWYLLNNSSIEKIYLTEKRDDLQVVFNELPWLPSWLEKMEYHQRDSFEVFSSLSNFDFILIDGVKADYLKFLKMAEERLNPGGLIFIDNSYWRGSFLDDEVVAKKLTAQSIKELHQYISSNNIFESVFIPFEDGVSVLRKKVL